MKNIFKGIFFTEDNMWRQLIKQYKNIKKNVPKIEKEYDDLTSILEEQQEFEKGYLKRLEILLKSPIIDNIIKETYAQKQMNITEATKIACQQPTLLDALTYICVWESERAIAQARNNYGSGANGAGWDTCFKTCLKSVIDKYPKEKSTTINLEEES